MRAIVTGGTRGIGKSVAENLLDQGFEVMITGTSIGTNNYSDFECFEVNFKDEIRTKEFLGKAKSFNPDILINNAGINIIDNFIDIKEDDFDSVMRLNLKIPFLISQAVLPAMIENRYGRIINMTSIFSKVSKEKRASYSASKFALDGLTKSIASELSEFNVLVNSVSPGVIQTDLTKGILGEEGIALIEKQIPQGRLGTTQEVAKLVGWLVSEHNTYISGQNILIDGGYTIV